MDRAALVSYRIEEGRRLLDRLVSDGLEVSAAFWLYSADDERWNLFVVSPSVDSLGLRACYMMLVLAMKEMPELRIDSFEPILLEPDRPLARAILHRAGRLPSGADAWIERTGLEENYIELAYLYPISSIGGRRDSAPIPRERATPRS